MTVTTRELGKRLRAAREAGGLKQEQVAKHLGVSRPTVTQMELGKRPVTSLELDKLAFLFGRDIREFLADEFRAEDTLVTLFRNTSMVSDQESLLGAVRTCMALAREITNLERLLEIERETASVPSYSLPAPRSRWEAIQQGQETSGKERRRLGLGLTSLPDVAEILESNGVRTAQASLSDDISGLTLAEPELGALVVANRAHHVLRRRFSYAHEYCHVLLDRDRKGWISRAGNRDDLLEVRANAFAAEFLMPEAGVRRFIHGQAKGRPSRMHADVFDEHEAVHVEGRSRPGTQDIQLYDVVLLAHHFGVSNLAALYSLRNARLLTQPGFDALRAQDKDGVALRLAGILGLPEPDHASTRNQFRRRFLGLGMEAHRRGAITKAKLRELSKMVDVRWEHLERVLDEAGMESAEEPPDVLLPG